MNFDQLLFSEFRVVPVHAERSKEIDEKSLVKAMTVNEELLNLGYTLSPKDVIVLSKSEELDNFYTIVKDHIGEVKAKPMYPNFPSQVMNMDEAIFRFHQMLHYLSTYGIECFTGTKVVRGWMPDVEDTEKTEKDDRLLAAKVLALIDINDRYVYPYKNILSRTERMTDKENTIIIECLQNMSIEQLTDVNVAFKENLINLFYTIFSSDKLTSSVKISALHGLCQHTGDVWKCIDYSLTKYRYHFKTSQKRMLVKLLESYNLSDFRSNLMLSNKKGERTILLLKFIDFNEYSRNPEFKKTVADFRNSDIKSWESYAKYLIENHRGEALKYISERPGIMLRMLTYLMRNGYDISDISSVLIPQASSLKTQTVVSLLNHFSKTNWEKSEMYEEAKKIKILCLKLLKGIFAGTETVLKNKSVFIKMPEYDLNNSVVKTNDKSAEGGYIRSGIAYKIPEDVTKIRFFVYWNDKDRVDVDLHGAAMDKNDKPVNIGWNTNYKSGSLVFSGDITHSDAAEFIDIDLVDTDLKYVFANINLFSGKASFGEIEECYVGCMAVKKTGETIKLYDPANCFFTHYLTGKYKFINYGYVDIENKNIVFDGVGSQHDELNYYSTLVRNTEFSLNNYLDILLDGQNVKVVDDPDEAEVVLVMGKPSNDNEVSLIDNNFFMDI